MLRWLVNEVRFRYFLWREYRNAPKLRVVAIMPTELTDWEREAVRLAKRSGMSSLVRDVIERGRPNAPRIEEGVK